MRINICHNELNIIQCMLTIFRRLANNEIEDIPAGSFTGQSQITDVFMSENNLISLPTGLFEPLPNLEHL